MLFTGVVCWRLTGLGALYNLSHCYGRWGGLRPVGLQSSCSVNCIEWAVREARPGSPSWKEKNDHNRLRTAGDKKLPRLRHPNHPPQRFRLIRLPAVPPARRNRIPSSPETSICPQDDTCFRSNPEAPTLGPHHGTTSLAIKHNHFRAT